jgi:hypothetical protein
MRNHCWHKEFWILFAGQVCTCSTGPMGNKYLNLGVNRSYKYIGEWGKQIEYWVLDCKVRTEGIRYSICQPQHTQSLSSSYLPNGKEVDGEMWSLFNLGSELSASPGISSHTAGRHRLSTLSDRSIELCFCSDPQAMGPTPHLRGYVHQPLYISPLIKLLSGSLSWFSSLHYPSYGYFPPRHCGIVSTGSLNHDCSLSSGPQSSLISKNRSSLKRAHDYSTLWHGE